MQGMGLVVCKGGEGGGRGGYDDGNNGPDMSLYWYIIFSHSHGDTVTFAKLSMEIIINSRQ